MPNPLAFQISVYGNEAAYCPFEYTSGEFTKLLSRLSAGAPDRAERAQFSTVSNGKRSG